MEDELSRRVGGLEQWQSRTDERIGHIEEGVKKTEEGIGRANEGVQLLIERDARRPQPTNLRTVAITLASACGVAGALGGFVYWFIAHSPAVTDLRARLTELDNPRVGRVPGLERRVDTLEGWSPKVLSQRRR